MYTSNNCKIVTKDNAFSNINNLNKEIEAIFTENLEYNGDLFQPINGRIYQRNLIILEGDIVFNIARKQWKQVEEAVLTEGNVRHIDVPEIRKQMVQLLSLCRCSLHECENNQQRMLMQNKLLRFLKLLNNTISRWSTLEERTLLKMTSASVTDDQLQFYHYFHMYLDVQWMLLNLFYLCDLTPDICEEVMKDLITISHAVYKKQSEKDIINVGAFSCTCVKRLWVLLQCFIDKLFKKNVIKKCFWDLFNSSLANHDCMYSLWLIHNVAMLQGYNEDGEFVGPTNISVSDNYSLIDSKLKSLNVKCTNTTNDNNQMLLNCCKLIDPLLNEWWVQSAKSEPYQILWEIFNKHINLPFGNDSHKKSAAELMELVNRNSTNTSNAYEYFLFILVRHLSKFPSQWPRIRGRIYCKLPPQKVSELSDTGLCNIALLFLSLAGSVNITEMTEKLASLLSNLTRDRQHSPLVLNIYMSLVILHAVQGFSIKEVCAPLLKFVQEVAENRETFHLVRLYVDGFDSVLNASHNFNLHQHLLIGSWVVKYMACCQHNDLCYFLNVLLCNIKRIRNAGAWSEWEHILKQHVLPGLKPVAASASAPLQVGELAALIDPNPLSEHVLTFTSDAIAPKVMCQFISTLLEDVAENYIMPKSHETAILHAWVRCCLLRADGSETLTKNVMKISALSLVFDTAPNFNPNPFCSFIKAMSKVIPREINLKELCEQCFGRLDCWIVPYITAPTSESLAVHMYTCVALLFFHCTPLLYHKNRSSCLLNRLVNTFLLPTDVLMGKSPHPYVLGAIHRTWHLFVHGIYALDCSSDAYLERTLRDMVARYVPLLPITDSPILKCLGNEGLTASVFERISSSFLAHSSRSSDGNTTKALKIVELAVKSSTSGNIELILKSTLTAIFEVIMFHSYKNVAVDIVKYIASCDKYSQLHQCVKTSFVTVTEKHLAFNANTYFQFANTLVKIIPTDMRDLVPSIKKQVVEVERMRGVGYDNTLRQGLDRLEILLAQQ